MLTKKEIINNLIVADELLKEIKYEIFKSVESAEDEEICWHFNSALINRNRIIINNKLKEIEK